MSMASKRWVDGRLAESGGRAPLRRLHPIDRGLDTDYVWVGGRRLEVPENTGGKRYLKVYLNGVTAPEWVDAMPASQDADSEVFDTYRNHIHLPGNYA